MPRAKASGQRPVLALDVVDNGRTRPGQQRRDDETDTLAATGGSERHDVFRAIVAEVLRAQLAQEDAAAVQETSPGDFQPIGPTG